MAELERRDWQLWTIVVGTGIVVGAGLVALVLPSVFLHNGTFHIDLTISRQLFLGLLVMLLLLNSLLIHRRLQTRRVREKLVSTTIQSELLKFQSFMDPLTEVFNRRSIDELAGRYISRAQRLSKPLVIMVIDIDRFKDANTRFGHLMGDFVLTEVSGILKGAVRGSDAVVRYGGDEFVVILADSNLFGADIVIGRLTKVLEDWNHAGPLPGFELTFSIGVAEWSENKNVDQLLNEADMKMYNTKMARKAAGPQVAAAPPEENPAGT